MHKLAKLHYDYDALEPFIDGLTMEIHRTRHHQGYVDKLNAALDPYPDLMTHSVVDLLARLDALPEQLRTAVRNHGGGYENHNLFFAVIGPGERHRPHGLLADAIDSVFGSFEAFQREFTQAALGVFGSGWAWLTIDPNERLLIETTPNQDSPWMQRHIPILGVDVWEHAYYLKYKNRRADYLEAFWNVVQWDAVSKIMTSRDELPVGAGGRS